MTGLELAQDPNSLEVRPIYVIFGDDELLRAEAWTAIRRRVLGDADDFAVSRFDGDAASFADINDELATLPFFGSHRVVLLDSADSFVTAHRPALERLAESVPACGVLVIRVKSWPSTTRLAKIVIKCGVAIDCKPPAGAQLSGWCRNWALARYRKRLTTDAAQLLVEFSNGGLAALDTELNKLSCYVGSRRDITADDVDQLVTAGRVETIWQMAAYAAGGQASKALETLDRLLVSGEAPVGLLAAMATQLRRLGRAARLLLAGTPMNRALDEAGFPEWPKARDEARVQLQKLGPERLDRLFDWLLETDLGMKGFSELSPRVLLERFIVRLSAPVR